MTRKTAKPAGTSAEALVKLFHASGALLDGHFLLSSGLHSAQYLQCALVLARPERAALLGKALAKLAPKKAELVLSPALGGLMIGQEVARALGLRHYFAERENGSMTLRRGFSVKPGERVLVVEDVITTGKSSREAMDVVIERGGEPVAALAIVDRSPLTPALGVPVHSLMKLEIPTYRPSDCPQCAQDLPLVKPGSRVVPR